MKRANPEHLTDQERMFLRVLMAKHVRPEVQNPSISNFKVRQQDEGAWASFTIDPTEFHLPPDDEDGWREKAPPTRGWFLPRDIQQISRKFGKTIAKNNIAKLRERFHDLGMLEVKKVQKLDKRKRRKEGKIIRRAVLAMRLIQILPKGPIPQTYCNLLIRISRNDLMSEYAGSYNANANAGHVGHLQFEFAKAISGHRDFPTGRAYRMGDKDLFIEFLKNRERFTERLITFRELMKTTMDSNEENVFVLAAFMHRRLLETASQGEEISPEDQEDFKIVQKLLKIAYTRKTPKEAAKLERALWGGM